MKISLGLFMARNMISAKKKFVRHAPAGSVAVAVERKICATPTVQTIRPRKLKFWFPASFGPI
jgi:hypothetical protein